MRSVRGNVRQAGICDRRIVNRHLAAYRKIMWRSARNRRQPPEGRMALFIGILGKFFARGDDGELPRPRRHCRALLGYVATHPDETLPRDRLAALLWPQNGSARHRLRHNILEIRQTLGPAAIAHIISGWTNFGLSGVSTDIAAFERL